MLKALQGAILTYSPLVVLLPLVTGLMRYRVLPPALRVLTLHLVMVAVLSGFSALLWFMSRNNLPLLHIYTILEFSMIAWFYRLVLKDWVPAALLPALILLFALFALANSLFIQDWYRFNTYPRSLESILIIGLSIACYYRMLSEMKIRKMERNPVFWINTGFLFYFSGALFLFSLSNYILPLEQRLNILIWTIHAGFSILLYLLIFIGLCNHRNA